MRFLLLGREWRLYVTLALVLSAALSACGPAGTQQLQVSPTAGVQVSKPTVTVAKTATASQEPQPTSAAETQAAAPTQQETSTIEPTEAANVQTFPDPAGYEWVQVVTGIGKPLDLQSSPDGSGRLFVVAQRGVIRLVKDGALVQEPFLDITDRVGVNGNEQGMLGLAFHPDFSSSGFFYVNYTDSRGDTVIARFSVSSQNPDQADPGSEQVLLRVDQPYANHNGGGTAFGPDGYLYLALGDGGSGGDPQGNGQSTQTLLGKLLRIDVNGGVPYAVPSDNPFARGGGQPEIWAYGLRNPWRFSFDRLTGDLYIADVGQNAWEEIDFTPAGTPGGVNYGWNAREGMHDFGGTPAQNASLVDPVFEYGHDQGCSVTGGYVYRGSSLPEFRGIYLFGDYCSGYIWGLLRDSSGNWQAQKLFDTPFALSSFGQDQNGEIYAVDQASGSVFRLESKRSH